MSKEILVPSQLTNVYDAAVAYHTEVAKREHTVFHVLWRGISEWGNVKTQGYCPFDENYHEKGDFCFAKTIPAWTLCLPLLILYLLYIACKALFGKRSHLRELDKKVRGSSDLLKSFLAHQVSDMESEVIGDGSEFKKLLIIAESNAAKAREIREQLVVRERTGNLPPYMKTALERAQEVGERTAEDVERLRKFEARTKGFFSEVTNQITGVDQIVADAKLLEDLSAIDRDSRELHERAQNVLAETVTTIEAGAERIGAWREQLTLNGDVIARIADTGNAERDIEVMSETIKHFVSLELPDARRLAEAEIGS